MEVLRALSRVDRVECCNLLSCFLTYFACAINNTTCDWMVQRGRRRHGMPMICDQLSACPLIQPRLANLDVNQNILKGGPAEYLYTFLCSGAAVLARDRQPQGVCGSQRQDSSWLAFLRECMIPFTLSRTHLMQTFFAWHPHFSEMV